MNKESLPTPTPETTPASESVERHEGEASLERISEFASQETETIGDAARRATQGKERDPSFLERFRKRALSRVAVTSIALASVVGMEGRPAEAGEGKQKAVEIGRVLTYEAEREMHRAEYRAMYEAREAEQALRQLEQEAQYLARQYTALSQEAVRLGGSIDDAIERNDARGVRRLMERQNAIRQEQAMIQSRMDVIHELEEEAAEAHEESVQEAEKKRKIGTGARILRGVLDVLRR